MMKKTAFDQAFAQLNPRQKEAVTTIDGPVLVLAGPGTGKTQVLTVRIGQILNKTQMNPYNILCLTYTEAAATEMKTRLIGLIGKDGYDVTITTFHGFANSIIQDFSFKFGMTLDEDGEISLQNLKPIDDLERLQIISSLLKDQSWKYIKPFKQPLFYLKEVTQVLGDMKRERITSKKLRAYCTDQLDILLDQEQKNASAISKLHRSNELADLFDRYQKELAKRGLYDYEDMINWVIDKFTEDPELALIYQEKYQYILVDEYQDSNASQLELIKRLTSFEKQRPNLFVVGDPDQSIYRFQGASHANIDRFLAEYPIAKQITLTDNYRSGQVILDAAKSLIKYNYSEDIPLLTAHKDVPGIVSYTTFANRDNEVNSIAKEIKSLIKSGTKPSEIALLVRKNYQISDIISTLDRYQIPYQTTKSSGIIKHPFVQRLIRLLKTIDDPYDRMNFHITSYLFKNKLGLINAHTLASLGPEKIFKQHEQKMPSLIKSPSDTFISAIVELSQKSALLPAAWILEETVRQFDILQEIDNHPDKLLLLNILKAVFDDAKAHKDYFLSDWLNHLTDLRQYELDLAYTDILYGEEEAVVVQTVHQSKGREYEYVFIPQLEEGIWMSKKAHYFSFPHMSSITPNQIEDDIAESRRLLYVGMTRAKIACNISVSKLDKTSPIMPSRFVSEIDTKYVISREINPTEEEIVLQTQTNLKPAPLVNFDIKEQAFIREIVQKRPLSPTALCTFLKCPRNFYLRHVLRMPMVKTESLAYGTAIHLALEDYFQEFKRSLDKPAVDTMLTGFDRSLEKEILSAQQKKDLSQKGHELLRTFYTKTSDEFTMPVQTEYNFSNHVHFEGIPLTGKIDKIEWLDPKKKTVRVIDYKTGRVKSRNALLGKTKYPDTDYITQLKFYCLLAELEPKFYLKWSVGETTLLFLDEEYKFKSESFVFTKQEMDEFKKILRDAWERIQALDFPHVAGAQQCEYCELITL